ncbi:hypothetical protein NESM_000741800 [Novymonas esmeraldas]|uniref:Uncharacterized protein n=1 Tax=Novymonas esmeraldas TaxID=1808958 RepID=A0AAW0EXJ9_9TRYP
MRPPLWRGRLRAARHGGGAALVGKSHHGLRVSSSLCSTRCIATSAVRLDPTVSTSASALADETSLHPSTCASHFSARLLSSPHRDVTHVPYGDWFALYVQARKQWRLLDPSSTTTAAGTETTRGEGGTALAASVQQAKQGIDALLLGSLFARHWTEVEPIAPPSSTSTPSSLYRWWWHSGALVPDAAPPRAPRSGVALPVLELCTPSFLTEPLLGGSHLRLWMEDARAAAPVATEATDATKVVAEAPIAVLPFSSLWVVKESAYWRHASSSVSHGGSSGSGESSIRQTTPALSLQERQARQTLLQSVDQLMQLQCDAAAHRSVGTFVPATDQQQRVCVLSPTQEWDLMCALPRYRQAVCRPAHSDRSASVGNAPPSPPWWLSLSCLCEDTTARLAYCAHTLSWQWQARSSPPSTSASGTASAAIRVLAPSTDHAALRRFALSSLHEHASVKEVLQRRHAARRHSASPSLGASGASVHEQARKGCSDAARRLSHREENIRQSFSVR